VGEGAEAVVFLTKGGTDEKGSVSGRIGIVGLGDEGGCSSASSTKALSS